MDFTDKTGLVSISFRGKTPAELIEASKKAGLCFIEWGSDVHAKKDDKDNLLKIAGMMKEAGIKCSSYGTYFKMGIDNPEELNAYADAAKILGTDIIRVWAGNKDPQYLTFEEKMRLFGDCRKAAKIAEKKGVTICFECHNWTYVSNLKCALELIEYAGSKNIAMYWQPNQFRSLKTNLEYASKIAEYTKIIHVFNWDGDDKFPLIDSVETWKKYLECFGGRLAENDMKFLLEFMPDGKIESLKTEADAMRMFLTDKKR